LSIKKYKFIDKDLLMTFYYTAKLGPAERATWQALRVKVNIYLNSMPYMDFISFLALISRIKTFYKMWYSCNFIEVKRTQSRTKGVMS